MLQNVAKMKQPFVASPMGTWRLHDEIIIKSIISLSDSISMMIEHVLD